MGERYEHVFDDDVILRIVLAEDGYNVSVVAKKPLMGTFTSFENLISGIGVVLQEHCNGIQEVRDIAADLSLAFSTTMLVDEIEEMLMK